MRASTAARLLIGTTLLVAGFGVLKDESPARGTLAQAAVGLFDMKDRQCRHAPVAVGSTCPTGCEARPIGSAEGRATATECRSPLWIATCGKACAPSAGYARLPKVGLVDGGRLIVTLKQEPDQALRDRLSAIGVTLTPRFDGLDRYDAVTDETDIAKIEKRLSALPQVVSAEFVPR